MERLNMVEKTKDKTTIKSRGLNTLQIMPNELRAYFRLISLAVNSRMTNVLSNGTYRFSHATYLCLLPFSYTLHIYIDIPKKDGS